MILEEQMQVPEVRGDVIIARYLLPEVFQCQTLALKIGLYSFYPLKTDRPVSWRQTRAAKA